MGQTPDYLMDSQKGQPSDPTVNVDQAKGPDGIRHDVEQARAQVRSGTITVAAVIPKGFGDQSAQALFRERFAAIFRAGARTGRNLPKKIRKHCGLTLPRSLTG